MCAFTKNVTDVFDALRHRVITGWAPAPYGFDQFILRNDRTGTLCKIAQHVKGLRSERQVLAVPPERLTREIDNEAAESKEFPLFHSYPAHDAAISEDFHPNFRTSQRLPSSGDDVTRSGK